MVGALLAAAWGTMPGWAASPPACEPGAGGLDLPAGFCAVTVATSVGRARHLVVRDNGDVYVMLRSAWGGGGIVALRDENGDGRADVRARFGEAGGTGIALREPFLYVGTDRSIVRYRLPARGLVPQKPPETVVSGFPPQGQHAAKSLALGEGNALYVNVGAPSNACQRETRTRGSPGLDPCPQRRLHAGIWHYAADQRNQRHQPDQRFATGIRNAVALDWNPADGRLYVVQHGRDSLHGLWPELFTAQQNAELPAEELFRVMQGSDFGWPYCYYDGGKERKVLAPEYGGDGVRAGRCAEVRSPLLAFPAHWAPNDLLFYTGTQFPSRYRGGAFIAFHGSWNRAPFPQQGYRVVFVPFTEGEPAGGYETFANGFAGAERIRSPGQARYRPMGLAQGSDGSLYIVDSVEGRIWRVIYTEGKPRERTGLQ